MLMWMMMMMFCRHNLDTRELQSSTYNKYTYFRHSHFITAGLWHYPLRAVRSQSDPRTSVGAQFCVCLTQWTVLFAPTIYALDLIFDLQPRLLLRSLPSWYTTRRKSRRWGNDYGELHAQCTIILQKKVIVWLFCTTLWETPLGNALFSCR